MIIGIASYFESNAIGGTETQTGFTMKELHNLGQEVRYIKKREDLVNIDILHVFHCCREEYLQYCKYHNIPVVVSTIYWNPRELFLYEQNLFGLIQDVDVPVKNHKTRLQKVLPYVSMLLPNSYSEYGVLLSDFSCTNIPYRVIPNGVDKIELDPDYKIPVRDYILCVGRIEVRKNQLQLINATPKDIPLVFIGNKGITDRYVSMCKEAAERRGNTYFYDAMPHKELWNWLYRCKAYCQPSWYETPGLVSLMAASIYKPLILTARGSCKEIFPHAEFTTPCSVEHISNHVSKFQFAEGATPVISWKEVTELTINVYKEVLAAYNPLCERSNKRWSEYPEKGTQPLE